MTAFKKWLPRILLTIAALAYLADIGDRFSWFGLHQAKEETYPTASVRLLYGKDPVHAEIIARENVVTKYTAAYQNDGSSVTQPGKPISWSYVYVVFQPAVSARNLRVRFENGGDNLIYRLEDIKDGHLAVVRFDGSLADKVISLEFY